MLDLISSLSWGWQAPHGTFSMKPYFIAAVLFANRMLTIKVFCVSSSGWFSEIWSVCVSCTFFNGLDHVEELFISRIGRIYTILEYIECWLSKEQGLWFFLSLSHFQVLIDCRTTFQRMKELQESEGSCSEKLLRLSVETGGCSGFQYVFDLDDKANSDDRY